MREQPPACSCDKCKDMCKRSCWPSPEEAEKMLNAGLGPKLMLDQWAAAEDINLLCGASASQYEGLSAPWWPDGRSTIVGPMVIVTTEVSA